MNSVQSCILCGAGIKREPICLEEYNLELCDECKILYVSNPPGKDEIRKLYSSNSGYQKNTRPNRKKVAQMQKHSRRNFRFFAKYARKGSILDVGCSYGFFLQLCSEYQLCGLEINPSTCRYARQELNIQNISQMSWEEFVKENPTVVFENICFWDVLEHLSCPAKTIEECHRALSEKGMLFIGTPNWQGLFAKVTLRLRRFFGWYHPEPPYHLFQFCKSSLEFLLKENGFKTVRTEYHHLSIKSKYRRVKTSTRLHKVLYVALVAPLDMISRLIGSGDYLMIAAQKE